MREEKNVIFLIVMFSMLLSFKFRELNDLLKNAESLTRNIYNLPTLFIIVFLATSFLYSAKKTNHKFLKFMYLLSVFPLILDAVGYFSIGLKYLTIIDIALIIIILTFLIKYIIRFIDGRYEKPEKEKER